VQFRGQKHFAAQGEPVLSASLARVITGVSGLDDLSTMQPRSRPSGPVAAPNASLGGNCCHLSPNDLRSFYGDSTGLDGAGQTLVIAGVYAWKSTDNTNFNSQWGLPQLPAGSGQVCTAPGNPSGCQFNNQNSVEVALDVEYSHGTAPGAIVRNYMAASTAFSDFAVMYNRIVSDAAGYVVTTSWGACEAEISAATQQTNDSIFANAGAIGQTWFAASGDGGSRDCSGLLTVDHPANSPHVIGVGGTTPVCSAGMTLSSPACAGYGSETGWSGSGGGISTLFTRPSFQTGCGVLAGSMRLVPDVALEASSSPGNYVVENGSWWIVGGTSGAAPQWAGFFAKLSQLQDGALLGNPGAYLYALCGAPRFHDITSGSNGDYSAGVGYDLVTGLGSIDAGNFFSPLAPVYVPSLSRASLALVLGLLVAAGVASTARRS
jgi:kumamolisin